MYCFAEIREQRFERIRALELEKGEEILASIQNTGKILETHSNLLHLKKSLLKLETWCRSAQTGGEWIKRNLRTSEELCRNFLFEFRTYLDHMQTMLDHDYGKTSQIFQDFINGTHLAYDNCPEYGFTYQLRNCSQHCENIVHSATGDGRQPGIRPASNGAKLLAQFGGWKAAEKTFIQNSDAMIDLQHVFEKTYDALEYVHAPVIRHMLAADGVAQDVVYLRRWADWLTHGCEKPREEIWYQHFAHAVHSDNSEATPEEYNQGAGDINFEVRIVDWEAVYDLSDGLGK